MGITAFDHYTVRAADLAFSRRFYGEVLGLEVVDRPGMDAPAALVLVGGQTIAHLFQASDEQQAIFARLEAPDDETAIWATGRMHHVSFQASDLTGMRKRLQEAGSSFGELTLEAFGKHLIILKDPDGVEIELQFSLEELHTAGS